MPPTFQVCRSLYWYEAQQIFCEEAEAGSPCLSLACHNHDQNQIDIYHSKVSDGERKKTKK